jgi:hypothetical protein
MKLRSLGLVVGILITSPAYADEATIVIQDLGSKWRNAYNSGDAAKIADLYLPDAILSSGVLGTLKGKAEIEKAVADQMKKNPRLPSSQRQATRAGMWFGVMAISCSPADRPDITGSRPSTTRVHGMSPCTFLT